ncbi:SDR family NAD(P)-dependent oxidoreductase [Halalkalibacterium ligniniphilum]|uniref:SDR family NAD(P)-dependent oxidoreductase n=1 Tax=Halalkalibacterium ligniniphilum TaxID=1134413 RepID=UPI00034A9DCA|nr:SDR family oxidoreductase [Halalkalibacterium ligniniphilum]
MLQNKIIFITGASSGLGRQLAFDVSRRGATSVLFARSKEKLDSAKEAIERNGGVAHVYPLDVSDHNQIPKIINQAIDDVGGVDVLVNNAGYATFELFSESDMTNNKMMFDVNVLGIMAVTHSVLPTMVSQGKGHIVNIASQAGKLSTPKSSVYAATKHAVLGFTNSLRMELEEKGIHVSAINPGPIRTPFFEQADQSGSYVKNIERYMLDVEDVSEKIIRLLEKPRRELNLPWWMNIGATIYQVAPRLLEKLAGKQFRQK